jgi:hypothetical protein
VPGHGLVALAGGPFERRIGKLRAERREFADVEAEIGRLGGAFRRSSWNQPLRMRSRAWSRSAAPGRLEVVAQPPRPSRPRADELRRKLRRSNIKVSVTPAPARLLHRVEIRRFASGVARRGALANC